jgi:hypothetical protein
MKAQRADASTIVRNLLRGQYEVLALNVEEGWVRDVSEIVAAKVQDVAGFEQTRADRRNACVRGGAQRAD